MAVKLSDLHTGCIVWFQEIAIPTQGNYEGERGGGGVKSQSFKGKYGAKLGFPEGGEGKFKQTSSSKCNVHIKINIVITVKPPMIALQLFANISTRIFEDPPVQDLMRILPESYDKYNILIYMYTGCTRPLKICT